MTEPVVFVTFPKMQNLDHVSFLVSDVIQSTTPPIPDMQGSRTGSPSGRRAQAAPSGCSQIHGRLPFLRGLRDGKKRLQRVAWRLSSVSSAPLRARTLFSPLMLSRARQLLMCVHGTVFAEMTVDVVSSRLHGHATFNDFKLLGIHE